MRVIWKSGMEFEACGDSGIPFTMDSHIEFGGQSKGPTPVEALLGAAAACSAMDVISILKKKKQDVTGYRVEITGERTPEGTFPRPFHSITIRHVVCGNNLDEAAVARSVQLSDEKYCTVLATLRAAPTISSSFEVAPAD